MLHRLSYPFRGLGRNVFALGLLTATAHAGTIYVNGMASGANNGSSWTDAYTDLQSALAVAAPGDDIWVAAGTYKPTSGSDRNVAFELKTGVGVYGGFAGIETLLSERDWTSNVTVLSGDLGTPGDNADNSLHVITSVGCAATAVLDGFTITGGNANGAAAPDNNGGGMYNDQSSPTLSNCSFTGNEAVSGGGGMYNDQSSPTLSNCSFTANYGRGMHNYNASSPTLTNCSFTANYGGGMLNHNHTSPTNSSSPTLTNCNFTANYGSGMDNDNYASPTLNDCTFTANSTNYSGGGMCNDYGSSPTLSNCSFTGNSAYRGGGMYNVESSSPTLSNCSFTGNSADCGGGMCSANNTWPLLNYSSPTLSNCSFTANVAYDGGGMCNDGSSPTLTNCTFTGNSADDDGGGMDNDGSSPTLTNCTFTGNSADYGGGMDNDVSSPTLTDCSFSDNSAVGGGGLRTCFSSSLTLSNCTFTANLAAWRGGAIYNGGSFATLTNCTLTANSADCGGGMWNSDYSAPTLSNCTLTANSAAWYGGGMCNESASATLSNCTFTANSADAGGAMRNYSYSSPRLNNCILWGDTAATGAEIYGTSFSTATVTYSDVQGGYGGTANFDADPRFVGAGDCRLQAGSPCIDAANGDVAPPTDTLGHARYDDPATPNTGTGTPSYADVGAYEHQAAGTATGLAFTVQPTDTVAGASLSAVQVTVQDDFGNTITTATDAITLAIGSNPGDGSLAGTPTVNAAAGVASFTDLGINRAGVGYTLTASATGMVRASSSTFDIVPGPPSQLVFSVQPRATRAGSAISPAVEVAVADTCGNTVTTATDAITVAIGANPGGGTLAGTLTVNAVAGLATFSDLSIDQLGVSYALTASATGLVGTTSSEFDIVVYGPPSQLIFTVQPGATCAGTSISPAVQVAVADAFGTTVATATDAITVAIGSNPGSGTLAGTLTVNAVAGLASFSNLSIDRAGVGYTLTASATGLAGATTSAFDIVPGPPSQLVFALQPGQTCAGANISPAVQVAVADALGNTIATATDAITVGLGANPGGGTLAGTLTVNAVAGVASFSDLHINRAGVGYTLTATANGLAGTTSSTFDVVPGPPSQVVFAVQPGETRAGTRIAPAVQVAVQDAFGNTVTTASDAIALAIGSNPGGGTLAGTLPVNAVAGVASFSDLRINRAGVGYTLTASATGLAGATSNAFDITPKKKRILFVAASDGGCALAATGQPTGLWLWLGLLLLAYAGRRRAGGAAGAGHSCWEPNTPKNDGNGVKQ